MKRHFSTQQTAYMLAKAAYDVRHAQHNAFGEEMDKEGERLGLEVPYAILPDDHPMIPKAQALLDLENVAKAKMYRAAFDLFDWATETSFTHVGTKDQHEAIRTAVAQVKTMAYVETHFQEMIDICMRLAA